MNRYHVNHETDMTPRTIWHSYGELWKWLPGSFLYVMVGSTLSLAGFITLVSLLTVGVATLIMWVGIPLLLASLFAARGFAVAQGYLLRLTGLPPIPSPDWERPGSQASSWWVRLLELLRGGHYWMAILYGIVVSPVISLASFTIAVTWVSVAVAGSFAWLPRFLNQSVASASWGGYLSEAMPGLFGQTSPALIEDLAYLLAGVIFLATAPWVFRCLAWLNWVVTKAMVGRWQSDDLAAQAEAEQKARASAVKAENDSLRRLERDIHDGPQQQLLRLQLDLATLQRRAKSGDSEATSVLAAEAQTRAKAALDELRALSAGVAPPLLQDRGLTAAIEALATNAPLSVTAEVSPGLDLEVTPETARALYFSIAELLTNATKHSQAESVAIEVATSTSVTGGSLIKVRVSDDGRGGAHQKDGHGLAGLEDRVAGLRGTLDIVSPKGGPTIIEIEVPAEQTPIF